MSAKGGPSSGQANATPKTPIRDLFAKFPLQSATDAVRDIGQTLPFPANTVAVALGHLLDYTNKSGQKDQKIQDLRVQAYDLWNTVVEHHARLSKVRDGSGSSFEDIMSRFGGLLEEINDCAKKGGVSKTSDLEALEEELKKLSNQVNVAISMDTHADVALIKKEVEGIKELLKRGPSPQGQGAAVPPPVAPQDDRLVPVGFVFDVMDQDSKKCFKRDKREALWATVVPGHLIRETEPLVHGRTWSDANGGTMDAMGYLRLRLAPRSAITGGRVLVGGYATEGNSGANQPYSFVETSIWGDTSRRCDLNNNGNHGVAEFYKGMNHEGWINLRVCLGDHAAAGLHLPPSNSGQGTSTPWARGVLTWTDKGHDLVDFPVRWDWL